MSIQRNVFAKSLFLLVSLTGYFLNAQKLQLSIADLNSNSTTIPSFTEDTYLNSAARTIQITCEKKEFSDGFINIFLNRVKNFETFCNAYQLKLTNFDYYCLSKTVVYDATYLNTIDDFLTIDCLIEGAPDLTTSIKIYKMIDEHSLVPVIRSGSKVYQKAELPLIDIDTEIVSCEITISTGISSQRYGIQWFNEDNDNFMLDENINSLKSNVTNISSTFVINSKNQYYFNPSEIHKCCSVLNNRILNCSLAYLTSRIIKKATTTTTSTTTTTIQSTSTTNILVTTTKSSTNISHTISTSTDKKTDSIATTISKNEPLITNSSPKASSTLFTSNDIPITIVPNKSNQCLNSNLSLFVVSFLLFISFN